MRLLSIELINWRAFAEARFEFKSDETKNLVVIGAPNGHGKTSFFEAVTLCLYGKAGLALLARASEQEFGRPSISYDNFLRQVLHLEALKTTRRITINISFEKANGDVLTVERRWFFSPTGLHKAGDEEFIVRLNSKFLRPEEGQTEEDWEVDIIAEHFIPHSLARFFLFDGEMVRDFARMDMATQVRQGIEGLMGIPILRELSTDLVNYATKKRGEVRAPKSEENVQALSEEIANFRAEFKAIEAEIESYEKEEKELNAARDGLHTELSSLGTSGSKRLAELYQMQSDIQTQLNLSKDNIQDQIVSDFSLGLAGKSVIETALNLLNSDKLLEDWNTTKDQGDRGYENFVASISNELKAEHSEIPEEFHPAVISLVRETWGAIWHPRPTEASGEASFPEITGSTRAAIAQRLSMIVDESAKGIAQKFGELEDLNKSYDSNQREIRTQEAIGPRHEEIVNEINEISGRLSEINEEKGAKKNHNKALNAQIESRNAALIQMTNLSDTAQPIINLAERAERISEFTNEVISKLVPLQSQSLATKMTEIYSKLSNKKAVENVEIDTDFGVHLLNSKGYDIRDTAMSAGEEQIFSQALISAVVEVSNFEFPMIVDTPLARLDDAHRKSILNYYMSSGRQVIFLSTDTEIVGDYYDEIAGKVSDEYIIHHNNQSGVGYSSAKQGYFDRG